LKTLLKLTLLVAMAAIGGLAGMWVTPHDMVSNTASLQGIFTITGGALSGLFLGGLCVLLCD